MPQVIEVPNYGPVEFPDDTPETEIAGAIRKNVYGLAPLPEMPEYDPQKYSDRQLVSKSNLQTAGEEGAKRLKAFEEMSQAAKAGQVQVSEEDVLKARQDLNLARDRYDVAAREWATVQKDPAPLGKSFEASFAKGALNQAAAAVENWQPVWQGGDKAFDPAKQKEYDALRTYVKELGPPKPDEDYETTVDRQNIVRQLGQLETPRESTLAGKLAGAAEESAAFYGVNPNAPNTAAQIGRGAGTFATVLPSMLLGGAGLPVAVAQMGGQTYESAYTQKAKELRAAGEDNDLLIDEAAQNFATAQAVKEVPALAAYLAGGKLASGVVAKILPEASPVLKGLAGTAAATGANVAVGGALRKFSGEDFLPTVEQLTQDALFGVVHGVGEGRKALSEKQPITEEPTNAEQISETSAPDGGVRPRGEVPIVPPEEGGTGVQPSGQGERMAEGPRGPSPQEIVPAIKVGEDVIKGSPGETHQDVLNRFRQENPDRTVEALMDFNTKENPNFFVGPDEVPISREQLQEKFGVSDSQGLAELQQQTPQRNLGPGAANVEEPLGTGNAIGAKNASVDAQRVERGLPPLMSEGRKANPETWAAVERRVETDPEYPARIVNEIENGERKSVTDEDQAALLWRMVDLRNQRDVADQRAQDEQTYSPEERTAYEEQANGIESELQRTEEADRKIGTKSARALQIRKIMANEDFTLAAMERRARKAKGDALTPDERATIKTQSEKIQETQKALDEQTGKAEEADSLAAAREALAKAAKIHPKVLEYAEGIVAKWEAEAIKARQDIREAMGLASANPLQFKVAAAAFKIARAKIARGLLNASEFVTDLVKEFGEGIRATAQKAWDRAFKSVGNLDASKTRKKSARQLEEEAKAGEEAVSTEDGIRAILAGGETKLDALAPYIQKLGNEYARSGESVEGVESKLFELFKDALPGVTSRELRDTWSDYGKSKAATTDPQKIAQAQRRAEAQKMSALDDLMAKRAALRTGQQRPEMSDRYRQLTKQINEKKKELGIVEGDPAKRLKSTLEAMETRVKNRINDLRFEIAKGERTVKGKTAAPTSPKLEAMRKELATVQAEHDAVFGKRKITDEQRLKAALSAAKRAEASASAELANARKGIFSKPAEKGVTRSTELDAIRARTTAAREEVKLLEQMANPPLSEAQKRLDAALVAKERWEQVLAGEITPGKKPSREALTQLEEDARAEIAAMRELVAELRRGSKAPDEAAKAQESLNRALAEKERIEGLLSGEITEVKKTSREALSQMEEDVRLEIQSLRKLLAEQNAKPKADPNVTKENAQVTALEKAAADYEKRLNEADFTGRGGKKLGPDTARVAAARALRDAARTAFDAAKDATKPKRSDEEIAIQIAKTRLARQTADLQDRIAKGDFAKRPRKELDISKDPEAVRLKAENERVKKEFAKARFEDEQRKRHAIQKVADVVKNVIMSAPRTLKTAFDVSAPFRQGAVISLGDIVFNPARFARQMGRMFGSLKSEKYFQERDAAIHMRPNAEIYETSKLDFSNLDGKPTAKEENMRSDLAEKIPGVRMSNRAYAEFLNEQRADAMDAWVDMMGGKDRITPAQAEFFAKAINDFTGRSNLDIKGAAGVLNWLAKYLFSPRYFLSRLKVLSGAPVLRGILTGPKVGLKARLVVAATYGKAAVGLGAFYALASLFFGDKVKISKDPRSSDFGKVKIGPTRIDPMAGLQQIAVLLTRGIGGKVKTKEGDVKPVSYDTLATFARGKLAPFPGAVVDRTFGGGKNVVGEKVTLKGQALDLVTPLSLADALKTFKAQGPARGTAIQLLNMLGMGTQTY